MSAADSNPEVVVLGMPSCGKTVFLSVLGKKFTDVVDGRRAAPLGFRLSTCDVETAEVVNNAYDRLREGKWPSATNIGQTMPLRWELFTGKRRVFELFSMDIAGETFKEAFGIKDSGSGKANKKQDNKPAKSRDSDDDDLFRGNGDSAQSSETDGATGMSDAAQRLKNAVDSAKVVCFLINISLPESAGRSGMSSLDATKLNRFRGAVVNMYLLLKKNRALRSRSVIVLTQAHAHQAEIDRAGGPCMFLGDLCGGEAVELCNLAKDNDMPVIAVSAVNESEGENSIPEIHSPSDIPSDGLFGFLLLVAGMAGGDKCLANIKNAYMAYQRARVDYLQTPSREISSRYNLARAYKSASESFVEGCRNYLSNPANFTNAGGRASPGAFALYRRCTLEDPEVKAACDGEYILRDEIWDGVLRQAAMIERTGGALKTRDVYVKVRQSMEEAFPGRTANEAFVYGFDEDELAADGIATTNDAWIRFNIDNYANILDSDLQELSLLKEDAEDGFNSLKGSVGKPHFYACRKEASKKWSAFSDAYDVFLDNWQCSDDSCPNEVLGFKNSVDAIENGISQAKQDHDEALRCIAEIERSRRAARKMRNRIIAVSLAIMAIIATISFDRYWLIKINRQISAKINDGLVAGDYDQVERLYGLLNNVGWLDVSRDKYLCGDFWTRFVEAKRLRDLQLQLLSNKQKLLELRTWLESAASDDESVRDAISSCDSAVEKYRAIDIGSPALGVMDCNVDFAKWFADTESCNVALGNAIEKASKVKGTHDHRRMKRAFDDGIAEAEQLLSGCEGKVESVLGNAAFSVADASELLKEIESVSAKILSLEAVEDADKDRAEALKARADASHRSLKECLDRRIEADRKSAFEEAFAELKSSVDGVREKIGKIADGASDIDDSSLPSMIANIPSSLNNAIASAGNCDADIERLAPYKTIADDLQAELSAASAKRRKSEFDMIADKVEGMISGNDISGAHEALKSALESAETDEEKSRVNELRNGFIDRVSKRCDSELDAISEKIKALRVRMVGFNVGVKWIADQTLMLSGELDNIGGLVERFILGASDEAERLVGRIDSLRSGMPYVVVIRGVDQNGGYLDIRSERFPKQVKVSNAQDTASRKECVYVLVPDDAMQSWLVHLIEPASGKKDSELIQHSSLKHGVNVIKKVFR